MQSLELLLVRVLLIGSRQQFENTQSEHHLRPGQDIENDHQDFREQMRRSFPFHSAGLPVVQCR